MRYFYPMNFGLWRRCDKLALSVSNRSQWTRQIRFATFAATRSFYQNGGLERDPQLDNPAAVAAMYPAGNLFVPVVHGQLEAIIKPPRDEAKGVALVLHPHPLGGGTMHNKVVFRAAAALNDAGLTTLRLNFRGVGQSTGEHDEGRGELDDVRAGLDYLVKEFPEQPITLCGFSFGARVGLEVGISDERVVNLISIGTPVDKYDFSFLDANRKPILFVHGDHDEFGSLPGLMNLVEKIQQHNPSVTVQTIKDCGHFFEGHLDELKQVITDWAVLQLQR